MNTLDQILSDHVGIGFVFDDRSDTQTQLSKMWTELLYLTGRINYAMGETWVSADYYNTILREPYHRSKNPGYWSDSHRVERDKDMLLDALDELTPPGIYFGPDRDYPHQWGFYREWRDV